MKKITEEIANKFYYDITSPSFLRWKENVVAGNKLNRKAGDIAGSISNTGYYRITINREQFLAHRIVYFLHFPEYDQSLEIDHMNQNKLDNSISNLRCVERNINSRNYPIRSDNKSGIVGISKRKLSGLEYWVSFFNENGKQYTKWFSILKHGDSLAKEMALNFRKQALERIGGYSDSHGT